MIKYTVKHVVIQMQTATNVIEIDRLRMYRFNKLWESCNVGDYSSIIKHKHNEESRVNTLLNIETKDEKELNNSLDNFEF